MPHVSHQRLGPCYAAAVGLAALFAGLAIDELHQISKHHLNAFSTYYSAATALREGRDPYGKIGAWPYVYPPLFAFACQPLSRLTRESAAKVMLAVNCCAILIALVVAAAAMSGRLNIEKNSPSGIWRIALTAALITAVPIFRELRALQADALVLLSFALALYWLDRRPACAGLALAFAISIKYVPLAALAYLLFRRRWRAAGAAVAGIVALAMLPAVSLGWSTNLHYLSMATGGLQHLVAISSPQASSHVLGLANATNTSVTSAIARLADAFGWSKLVGIAMVLVVFSAWAASLIRTSGMNDVQWIHCPPAKHQGSAPFRGMLAVEWAGVVTAAIVFSPSAELVLAVLPATLLAAMFWASECSASTRLLPFAVLVMWAALTLPIAATGPRFTVIWNRGGLTCWCLLAAYFPIYWSGVRVAQSHPPTNRPR